MLSYSHLTAQLEFNFSMIITVSIKHWNSYIYIFYTNNICINYDITPSWQEHLQGAVTVTGVKLKVNDQGLQKPPHQSSNKKFNSQEATQNLKPTIKYNWLF